MSDKPNTIYEEALGHLHDLSKDEDGPIVLDRASFLAGVAWGLRRAVAQIDSASLDMEDEYIELERPR